MDLRRLAPPLLACALLWMVAAAGAWLIWGWNIPEIAPPAAILSAFPTGALVASGLAFLLLGSLWLTGAALLPATSHGPLTRAAVSVLVGGAALGAAIGALSFLRIVPIAGLPVLTVAVLLIRRGKWSFLKGPRHRGGIPWEAIAVSVVLLTAGLAALAPAVESDGLRYHLVGPQEWVRNGRFVNIPYNVNSNLPALSGLLAAWGAGAIEAGRVYQLLQFAHLAVLAVGAGALARRLFRAMLACGKVRGDRAVEGGVGAVGALVVVGVPVVGLVGSWPFADVASCAYLVAGTWAVQPGSFRKRGARIAVGSLLLGACVATKISNLPLAGLVGLWALCMQVRSPRQLALLIAPGLLVLAPWLVKSALYHHNPVYPLAYGILGGPEWSPANEEFYQAKLKEKGMGRDAVAFVKSPWNVTVYTDKGYFEQQNPGPSYLTLLPVALLGGVLFLAGGRRRLASGVVLSGVLIVGGLVVWFATYQSVRFLIPVIVYTVTLGAALLMALGWSRGSSWWLAARAGLSLLGLLSALWLPIYHLRASHVYHGALGLTGEEVVITSRFATYPAIQWLSKATQKNEPVFYIGEHRAAYATHYKPLASDWFDTPLVLVEIRATADNSALLARWRERGIRHVLMNLAELSLYEERYFKPRFTAEEWTRFEALRKDLLERVVYDSGAGVFVAEVK
jgi:hypothetical protein